jgi:fatty-acyl-CoA synthase
LFFHSSLGDRVARVVDRLPNLTVLVEVVDDPAAAGQVRGAVDYEELLTSSAPMPVIERPGNDLYMFYTGGTTGMPKGVMYDIADITLYYFRHGFPRVGVEFPATVDDVASAVLEVASLGKLSTSVTGAPLMHGTGLWLGAMMHHLAGGHAVTLTGRSLDAHELLAAIERHRCTHTTIVGDAFAKPIVRAIDEANANGRPYDTSSLTKIISSGVMWTT